MTVLACFRTAPTLFLSGMTQAKEKKNFLKMLGCKDVVVRFFSIETTEVKTQPI
jgi:hypothetical protein